MQFYNENIDEQKLKNEYLKANSRCKYKTPEELQARIEEYFGNAHKANRAYTISGLAIYLGLSTEAIISILVMSSVISIELFST